MTEPLDVDSLERDYQRLGQCVPGDVAALIAEVRRLREAVNHAYLQRDRWQITAGELQRDYLAERARVERNRDNWVDTARNAVAVANEHLARAERAEAERGDPKNFLSDLEPPEYDTVEKYRALTGGDDECTHQWYETERHGVRCMHCSVVPEGGDA